ncbi:MAG: DNA polymerase III subunit gamma/tau [Lentisphaerae bacterium]|nr:DNA polymerase III subunit gamma/tau [Lentisphaerota bacterium]
MSYQVLARKWRPQTFAEVVGQEHIGRTLKNAILQNRIGHAYLFVGSRGIGKTTTARIFAKALNCRNPQQGEPCCQCDNCLEIAQGNSLDVIEIDGASHNKVEDIRDIRDSVMYSPNKSRFKIYIIDEVHMLTPAAWNALLKTLEEPPEHVKFLFATTEPHKVLATIISRCQRFDLRRIPVPLIVQHLRQIADKEGVRVEDQALAAIARAADGGMRDAQSIFDQMIAFCGGLQEGELIREQDVIEVFGIASGTELRELALAVLGNDLNRAMLVLQAMSDSGRDLERLFEDLISYIRNVMIATLCQDASRFLEVSASELAELQSLGKALDPQLVQRVLQALVAQEWGFRSALNKRIYLEVVLCRVITEAHSVQIDEVMTHLNVLSGILPREQMPEPRKQIILPPLPAEILNRPAPATPPEKPLPAKPQTVEQPAVQIPEEKSVVADEEPAPEPPVILPEEEESLEEEEYIPAPRHAAEALQRSVDQDTDIEFLDDAHAALPPLAAQSESSPEELLDRLCSALQQKSSSHQKLGGILSGFIPSLDENRILTLAYDQRKVGEHDVRLVLDPKNLALLKEVYKSIHPLGNIVIDRWNPAGNEELKPGLRQVSLEEMEKLAEDPFVKLFNERMGTTVIDARIPTTEK